MSNNIVEVSKMTLEDFDEIKDILVSDFDDFWNAQTFETELKNNESYYWVGKVDNKIIGFAGIKIVLDEADIMNVVIRKDCRNSGFGSILFKKILSFANENGINKLTLEVNEKNITAIHLYEKFNFKKIAVRKKYYNNVDDAIIMQLNLAHVTT